MSDQNRISPYNINTISSRQVMRKKEKYQLGDYKLIQYQILHTNITRTVQQTVRRITNQILGVIGSNHCQWEIHCFFNNHKIFFRDESSSYLKNFRIIIQLKGRVLSSFWLFICSGQKPTTLTTTLTISVGLKDDGKTLQACRKKHRSQMNAAIGTEKRICGVAWIGH